MRIVYIDIDSLRADHLGCYGYHRQTSPVIDEIARQGVRFNNCYYSDGPCLPSRSALFSGRFGIHTGVVDHLDVSADHFIEGRSRGFRSALGLTNWMHCLQRAGYTTVTVSSFAERHSAFNWLAGFREVYNMDNDGLEMAGDITRVAADWLNRNARKNDWFLHINYWDVHWPYRIPDDFGNPFAEASIPAWYTEEIRQAHWRGCGVQSAQDMFDFHIQFPGHLHTPAQASSLGEVRKMFDGYDTSLHYVDAHIGFLFDHLRELGVFDETVVIISADHGEALGELNVYAGHRFADYPSARLPLIVRWPGVTDTQAGRLDSSLHYHIDFAATVLELTGQAPPGNWDGVGFADAFRNGATAGRPYIIIGAGAAGVTRSIRFEDYLCMRVYHDGYQCLPDRLLFNVVDDPHEQTDLAQQRPELIDRAMTMLDTWYGEMMRTATHPHDPLWDVIHNGGPQDTRGWLPQYVKRLRQTGRAEWAEILEKKYPEELKVRDEGPGMKHAYMPLKC